MRLLIAGGAGYVGSVLIPKLLDRGYQVSVVDLLWFGNHLPPEAVIIDKDIFDLDTQDLEGYEQVIFLAGLSNDPMAQYSPSKNFIFNAAAPAYLAYVAKRAKARRFIYASSCSVYGYTENELFDETRPAVSSYPYGISKLQGEQAVLQMATAEFSVVALRQGTISGYSPRMRLDLIINTMFKTAIKDHLITVNNPSIWRPILGIEDAARAYIRAIEANPSISGLFNVASANHTVGEVADLVREPVLAELGIEVALKIKHLEDYRNYKVSIEKCRTVLSFHPKDDVRGIALNLIQNMDKFKDWENPAYYNIEIFKALENQAHAKGVAKPMAAK